MFTQFKSVLLSFLNHRDYYEKTSTLEVLDRVAVPQLIIQAKDDPFFFGQTSPTSEADWPLRIKYTENGGHCGYILHSREDGYKTSWMPTELARFLSHVDLCVGHPPDNTVLERDEPLLLQENL